MALRIKLSKQTHLSIITDVGNFTVLRGTMTWSPGIDTVSIVAVGSRVVHLSKDFSLSDSMRAWLTGFELNETDGPDARIIANALIAAGLAEKVED